MSAMNDDSRTRGRTVQLVGHVADFIDHSFQPASELEEDLYVRQAIELLGELCQQVGPADA